MIPHFDSIAYGNTLSAADCVDLGPATPFLQAAAVLGVIVCLAIIGATVCGWLDDREDS